MRKLRSLLFVSITMLFNMAANAQDFCAYEQKVLPSQANPLQAVGYSDAVALWGDYIIFGASGDDDNGWTAGAAYVYHRCGQTWMETQKIVPADGNQEARFGRGADMYEDYAVFGSPHDNDLGQYSGSVYVYKLIDGLWQFDTKILADDGGPIVRFGSIVKLWQDYLVIGCPLDEGFKGSAYIYRREGTDWVFKQKLLAPDGALGDNFGLTLENNNGYIVVGAVDNDDDGESSGAAYIYKLDGETWNYQTKITASDGQPGDKFGTTFYIEGNELLVGSPNRDSYEVDGNEGGLYIFHNTQDTVWTEQEIIISPENTFHENFGVSVDRSGDRMVVGTTRGFGVDEITGAAYFYKLIGGQWVYDDKLFASDGQHADFFSAAMDLQDNTIVCGAKGDDSNIGNAGTAYMYHLACEPMCTKIISPPVGGELLHDYSPITWASVDDLATGYMLAVGTAPGLEDVFATQDVGMVNSYFVPLNDQQEYFVTVTPYNDYGSLGNCGSDNFTTNFHHIEGFLGEDLFNICIEEIPPAEISYMDTCSAVVVELVEDTVFTGCTNNFVLTRTLTVTDDCGAHTTTQTLIGQDNFYGPVLTSYTDTIFVACGDVVPLDEPVAVDNCGEVIITYTDSDTLNCGTTIIRAFTVNDVCGHGFEISQVIVIAENTNPPSCLSLSSPLGEEVSLNAPLEWEAVTGATGYIVSVGTTMNGTDLVDSVDVGADLSYVYGQDWPLATTIYVTIMPYNEFGAATGCTSSEFVTILVGVEEITEVEDAMIIYPNPSADKVINVLLKTGQQLKRENVEVLDMSGRVVSYQWISSQFSNGQVELKLGIQANSGYYLLRIIQNKQQYQSYFGLVK